MTFSTTLVDAFANMRSAYPLCPSIHMHGTTRKPLKEFCKYLTKYLFKSKMLRTHTL
jgi:hypothetical protein